MHVDDPFSLKNWENCILTVYTRAKIKKEEKQKSYRPIVFPTHIMIIKYNNVHHHISYIYIYTSHVSDDSEKEEEEEEDNRGTCVCHGRIIVVNA